MSSTTDAKAPTIRMNFTVENPGKPNMTLKDIADVSTKAEAIKAELSKHGQVLGEVTIGKQVFKL